MLILIFLELSLIFMNFFNSKRLSYNKFIVNEIIDLNNKSF